MADTDVSNGAGPDGVTLNPEPGKKRKGRGKTRGFSIQKKRKDSDSGKLKVTIPPDRTVAVGPGAKDFVTELSVKVLQNARHDVKNWKNVPILVKDRIVAHMLIGLPAAILNIITDSSGSDGTNSTSLMDDILDEDV